MKTPLLYAVALIAAAVAGSSAARADMLVGVAAPLTGPDAALGRQVRGAAEKAAADINAAGGINGEKVQLKFADDKGDAKGAETVASQFVAGGVGFVVGDISWGASIKASEIYAANNVLEISPTSTNPYFTARGLWNTFRIRATDAQKSEIAARYVAAHLGSARVAVVAEDTDYGKAAASEAAKAFKAAGITEAIPLETVKQGESDITALAEKMKTAGVSFVYFAGPQTAAARLLQQLAGAGVTATVMSAGSEPVGGKAAADGADGLLAVLPQALNKASGTQDAAAKPAGTETGYGALYTYAAFQVIAEAAAAAGNNDPLAVATAARNKGPFKTVAGDLSFARNGDLGSPGYAVFKVAKGSDGSLTYTPAGE